MTLGLLGLVVLGGFVVVALLIAGVWYCVRQIAKWLWIDAVGPCRSAVANQLFAFKAGASTACCDGNSAAGELSRASNNAMASAMSETASRTW
jgi:hypothetical protein